MVWATQRPARFGGLDDVSGVPAWRTIPSWYLLGLDDQIIPASAQRAMAERAGSRITEYDAGHLGLMSDANTVARGIERAAKVGLYFWVNRGDQMILSKRVLASRVRMLSSRRQLGFGAVLSGLDGGPDPLQPSGPQRPGRRGVLHDRVGERAALDRLLGGVRASESQVLVIRGEAGIGKSALLNYVEDRASGCRLGQASGIEYEMELPFAGLHQLCAPMLDLVGRLPGPQQDALETAFGLGAKAPADRFVVGLAVLSLLSEAAAEQPLLCVIDDAQWLDSASALTIAFVARRLLAESIGLLFAVREPSEVRELHGLPELRLGGLGIATPANCSTRRGQADSTSRSGIESSPSHVGTRSRSSSCRGVCRRPSSRAGSSSRAWLR